MRARFFVAADVLAVVRDPEQGRRQGWAREWLARLWEARAGRLSLEVLHDLYRAAPGDVTRADVRNLLRWKPVAVDRDILERAWALQDQHCLEYPQALAVAAAEASECRYLLTEGLPDGRFLGRVQVVDPYRHSPHEYQLASAG